MVVKERSLPARDRLRFFELLSSIERQQNVAHAAVLWVQKNAGNTYSVPGV